MDSQHAAHLTLKYTLGTGLHLLCRPWVEGTENVPARGPAIIASNHLAFVDSMFIPLVAPRRVSFLAKDEYFTGSGIRGQAVAGFFRFTGAIPVDRTGGRAALAALAAGRRVLDAGGLFGIYPEGTRSPDGRLYRGRTGVARLAIEAGVPVIPACVVGTQDVQPAGRRIPRRVSVGVRFGTPLHFAERGIDKARATVARALTDEIMAEIQKLSGQEYVDRHLTPPSLTNVVHDTQPG